MKRTHRFGLALDSAERGVLDRLAEAEGGLSMAAIVRRLIRHVARDHGLWPADRDIARARQEAE